MRAAVGVALLLTAVRFAEAAAETKPIEAATVNLGHPVDFEKDVYPILEANCVACHNSGIAESKLSVETAETIRKGGKRGPAVMQKNPAASLLFQFASRAKQPAMPPLPNTVEANALSPKELGILKQWILEGAAGGAGGGRDAIQWQPIPAGMKSIESVAISPWGRFVAAGRANEIVVYDAVLGQEAAHLVDPLLSGIQFDGRPMYPGGAADRDFIHALAFSPDESLVAAGGYRVVKLWKRPSNVRKLTALLPENPTALTISPVGSLLAVATADKTIQLLSASNGATVRKLIGAAGPVTGLQFSANGKLLYAGSLDKSWRAWTVANGLQHQSVATPAAINAVVLSKDGTQLFAAGADGIIRAWSLASAKLPAAAAPIREWKGHTKGVTSLAVVLPAGTQLVSGSEDGTVRVWDIGSGKQAARVDHGGPVTAVAVRPDGQVMAAAGANKLARLWQIKDGKPIAELKGDLAASHLITVRNDAQIVAGQHIAAAVARAKAVEQDVKDRQDAVKKTAVARAAADKTLSDAKTKDQAAAAVLASAKKSSQAKPTDAGLKKQVDDAAKSAAAAAEVTKTAAAGVATLVRAQQSADKALQIAQDRLKQEETEKKVSEAAKTQADKELAAANAAGANSQLPIRALAFSADGKVLATAGDDPSVQLWDAHTGRALQTESGHSAAVGRVAFIGSSTLVSAAADKSLVVWDTNPAWSLVGRIGPKPDAPLELSASSFVGRVLCVAFNHQGTLLATGGGEPSRSGELKIWNVPTLSLARDLKDAHSDTVFGVEFSRDGKYLASGGADKFLKVFDVATGKHVRSFEGHTHHVLGVSWKADGSLLASAGADNQIKVWNFESGEQVRSIVGYAKQVTSIQFIGTGIDVVSSSGDKTVRLHHTSDGDNYRTFAGGTDFMYAAAAARDASIVAAGGEDGVLRVWNGSNGQTLLTFGPPKANRDSVQANAAKR